MPDIDAPNATMQVAKKCIGRGTRCQPNMAMPRKPASSMNAIAPSNPSMLPKKPPATLVNGAQLVPNSNSSGTPVTTPTPETQEEQPDQKRAW